MLITDITAVFPTPWKANVKIGNGESYNDVSQRAVEGLNEVLNKHCGEEIIIVSHGGPIKLLVCYFLGLPTTSMHLLEIENTCVTKLRFKQLKPDRILSLNDTHHHHHHNHHHHHHHHHHSHHQPQDQQDHTPTTAETSTDTEASDTKYLF
eukprot:TRINITY_DN2294_c0_g1_i1.p1 TRINITY_DN2294_c0_g1~~TRINITY_DN2294_c0_g1_i1.p1  ORF type:complete len:151 (+),score=24.39 TRINITY_DN2294_c0_g1_i1:516-968(+)